MLAGRGRDGRRAQHGAHGHATGDRLGNRHDVRHDIVQLACEHASGTSEAGLDLIHDQQHAPGPAQRGHLRNVLGQGRPNPTFALDQFQDHPGSLIVNGFGQLVRLVEWHEPVARDQGLELLSVLVGRAQCTQ